MWERGLPTLGTDATGADAYAVVVAAPSGNREWDHIVAVVSTYGALLSLDAGTTDQVYVPAGGGVCLDEVQITKAIYAKNATAGSNYTNLRVMVW